MTAVVWAARVVIAAQVAMAAGVVISLYRDVPVESTIPWIVATAFLVIPGLGLLMIARDLDRPDYTHASCDHDAACCTTHGTHTSPHMGCVLR